MAKEDDNVLQYMSERLKHEPYKSNPDSRLFLAELATVIFHIMQKDGKHDLQINDCFNNYAERIFDYSIKKIETTRNFNYLREKDDESLSETFKEMLDMHFCNKEILHLVQNFNEVESIDDNNLIIFKEKTNKGNPNNTKQTTIDEPFVINKKTKEQDIIDYFNNKIKEGYYTDIYKLLVDFSMMMYRKGALSIDLLIPRFDDIIKYINKQIISKFWFHQLSSEQLIPRFSYCWKNAKFNIIKKAADALQIPYQITGERYNQYIKLVKEKGEHHNTEEDDDVKKVRDTSPIIEETPKEIKATGEDVIKVSESEVIPYIYKDIESKLSELFDTSEIVILDEEIFLREINLLLCSQAWNNVYDLFGDIQYIIYNQKRLATYTNRTVNYNNIKFSQLEGRHAFFLRTFPKKLKLDTRQNSRKSYRDVWYKNYAVSTIERMGLLFEPIKSIGDSGKITLKPIHVSANEIIADTPLKQQHSPDNVFEYMDQLRIMYDESRNILLQESDILFIHRRIAEKREWENHSICIASIAYILIRQFGLNNNKQYKLLTNLYRKSIVINAKYDLLFEDNNHEENINKTLGSLIREYGNKLITEFYNSLIGINMSDNHDTSVVNEEKGGGENVILLEMYEDSGDFIVKESIIIDLHKDLAQKGEWGNASQCVASIAYIIIRQIKFANSPNALKFSKLKNLYKECKTIFSEDGPVFEKSQHTTNLAIVKEKLLSSCGMKHLVDFYRSITGLSYVEDDGTIYFPNYPEENIRQETDHPEDDSQKNTEINPNEDDENSGKESEEIIDEELEDTEEEYFPEEEDVELDEDEEIEEVLNDTPETITFECETRAEREFADFWKNTFIDGYYDTYIWKNKISEVEYCKIKNYLKSCINDPQRKDGFAKRFAKAIVLYCAEWYKREYNGNDGQGNPIEAIGIKSLRTKNLWEWAELNKNLLYSNEYLESIYTLGGLPIKYIKNNDKLMQEISDMYNGTTSEDSTMDRIFKNNRAIQYSIKNQKGSLHLLIKTLNDTKGYPIHQLDREKAPFKQFLKLLREWRPQTAKFLIDWIVEINDYTPVFRRKIRLCLKPEENGALNNCIPYYTLGEEFDNVKEFNLFLYFCDNEDDEDFGDLEGREKIRFTNNFKGHFIGENITDYYIFSDIPTYSFKMIKVIAQSKANHMYVTLQKEKVEPYLQLFKTWKYSTYSTKRNQGDTYILLPFDFQIHSGYDSDNSPKYLTGNGTKYRFIKINGQFTFTDLNGKEISQYEKNNKIEVSPPIHNNIFIYQNERYFTRVVTDKSGVEKRELVLLIFKKSDIKCTQYFDITEPKNLEDDEVTIKFKKENETFYSDWTDDNQPEQGFVKLQVNVFNRKIQLNVYYIPSDEIPFKRDCTKNSIVIDNCVDVLESDIEVEKETNNNKVYKGLNIIDRNRTDYYFMVGSKDDYIIIPVIKPLNITELYKDGEFIEEYQNKTNSKIQIPIQFKDKYSIRKYDTNGVTYHNLSNENVNLLDFEFRDDINSLSQIAASKNLDIPVEFYLCTDKICVRSASDLRIQIGREEADNYLFYFWDMNKEHDPEKVEYGYENDSININTNDYQNGIIFQSLEGGVCPRHYCMPILTTKKKKWPTDSESLYTCIVCFKIASYYNIPFRVFEPLYWLLKDTDSRLINFLADLMSEYWLISDDNDFFEDLVRLSKEMYFAWPFLNIKIWRNYKDECCSIIKDIFGTDEVMLSNESFKDIIIKKVKILFIKYGELTNHSGISHLEEFVNILWNSEDNNSPRFIKSTDYKWFTYDKNIEYKKKKKKWVSLPTKALCFMRARPIKNRVTYPSKNSIKGYEIIRPDIIGFCDHENFDNVRNIKRICEFLRLLYEDNDSYYKIIRFFKFYGIIK